MRTYAVGEFKAHFSELLIDVRNGEHIGIQFGKNKKLVAMLVPFEEKETKKERKIGILSGKAKITFSKNFKMTAEELLGIED